MKKEVLKLSSLADNRPMKKIDVAQELGRFTGYLTTVKDRSFEAVLWQLDQTLGKRVAIKTNLHSFDERSLHFIKAPQSFNQDNQIFVYIEALQALFKTGISGIGEHISCAYPKEFSFLDENDASSIQSALKSYGDSLVTGATAPSYVSDKDIFESELNEFMPLDQEDAMFASKRNTPRARPKKMKMITASLKDKPEHKIFELFDLSQGGLSFLCLEDDYFKKGDIIHIHSFDERNFESPMVGEVMSIRAADELGVQNKVGIKFIG